MTLVKFIIVLMLFFVVISLFVGLFFLVKDKSGSGRTVKALTVRIALSFAAIVFVIIAFATGLIQTNPTPL